MGRLRYIHEKSAAHFHASKANESGHAQALISVNFGADMVYV
jgi:hypothetical protein